MTPADAPPRTPPALIAGDVVRALVALSVVAGAVLYGAVGAALLSLVLLGAVVPRVLGLHGYGDPALGLVLAAAAWAGLLDLYEAAAWLDLVMHLVATAALAALGWLVLHTTGAVAGPGDGSLRRPRLGVVVSVTSLGALLALLWEIGEWAGSTYVDSTINVGYTDTVSDLAAGTAGSLVAGIVLARRT